jgi:hypothetical protein
MTILMMRNVVFELAFCSIEYLHFESELLSKLRMFVNHSSLEVGIFEVLDINAHKCEDYSTKVCVCKVTLWDFEVKIKLLQYEWQIKV